MIDMELILDTATSDIVSVDPGLGLLSFFIADTDTDEIITYIGLGDTIAEADYAGRNITIGAELADPSVTVGSVVLNLGEVTRVENFPPFMLFGDNMAGDYASGTIDLTTALQNLNVTIYEGANKTGAVIDSFTLPVSFEGVEDDDVSDDLTIPDDVLANQFDQIVLHFDGNNNDPDDIAAIPIAALLANAAGIQSKTTFLYGNNLSEASSAGRLAALDAGGAFAQLLGIDTYNYQDDIYGTTAKLVEMIDSGQSVLILEGGPVEATYRALEQANPDNLENVTLLSHSTWNQDRGTINNPSDPLLTEVRIWDDIREDFPDVTLIEMQDQNSGTNNFRGFYNRSWTWLDETDDPLLQDARTVMEGAGEGKKNDPSDAGMLFYALTSEADGIPFDVREYLEDPASYTLNDNDEPIIFTIDGTDENDVIYGTDDPDYIFGGLGRDRLEGWRGGDTMYGEGGQDTLSGHGGDDTLYGGDGRDVLVGGKDADHLFGGAGVDKFLFWAPDLMRMSDVRWDTTAIDVIEDFEFGVDTISFGGRPELEDKKDLSMWRKYIDGDLHFVVMVKETTEAILVNVDDENLTWREFYNSDSFDYG